MCIAEILPPELALHPFRLLEPKRPSAAAPQDAGLPVRLRVPKEPLGLLAATQFVTAL